MSEIYRGRQYENGPLESVPGVRAPDTASVSEIFGADDVGTCWPPPGETADAQERYDAWNHRREEWLAPIPGAHPVYPLYEVIDWKRGRDDWLTGIRQRLRLVVSGHGLPPDL